MQKTHHLKNCLGLGRAFGKMPPMTPQALLEENTTLRQQNTSLSQEIQLLREQIEWFKRQLFASRSEKVIDDEEQLPLDLNFEELVNEAKELAIASHTRKKMTEKGKDQLVLPENIPVKTQILDLPEEEKTQDGKPLVKIGEEVSDKLAHSPGSYYIKRIIPPKYGLPQGEGVKTQELPETLVPKLGADESLLAEVFTRKFADHLPLYRISESFSREGIGISRQLLSQWTLRCGGFDNFKSLTVQNIRLSKRGLILLGSQALQHGLPSF